MLTLESLAQYAPAHDLGRLGEPVLALGLRALMLALVSGGLAWAIHRRRLHWSLSACALVWCTGMWALGAGSLLTSVPIAGALGAPGLILAILVATRVSRGWQLAEEDVRAVSSSGERFTIGDLLRALRRPARVPSRWRGENAAGRLLVGETCRTRRPVWVPPRHAVLVGATGAGKTMTMRRILGEAVKTMGAVVVDGKGDPELERDLERFAVTSGRRFVAWSPHHSTRYSPFGHGSDTEIVDKALAAERWGDDYYLRLGQRFLGFAVRALRAAGREPTLQTLAHYVDPGNLEQLAPEMETATPGSWNALVACLPALERAERQAIAGTQHRLAALAESDVGALLEPAPGEELVDLLASVRSGDVAYFNLNADARPALSRMVGAAVVMDLVSVAATMQRSGEFMPTVLTLDDVQAFATDPALAGVASLFARGRSAGMMVLLGTQSLADFQRAHADGGVDQLLDNRATLLVHRLPGHASATRASLELGTREVQRLSEHVAVGVGGWRGRGTAVRSRASEPYVRPAELMGLPTGVAVLKSLGEQPRLVRVSSPRRD